MARVRITWTETTRITTEADIPVDTLGDDAIDDHYDDLLAGALSVSSEDWSECAVTDRDIVDVVEISPDTLAAVTAPQHEEEW